MKYYFDAKKEYCYPAEHFLELINEQVDVYQAIPHYYNGYRFLGTWYTPGKKITLTKT